MATTTPNSGNLDPRYSEMSRVRIFLISVFRFAHLLSAPLAVGVYFFTRDWWATGVAIAYCLLGGYPVYWLDYLDMTHRQNGWTYTRVNVIRLLRFIFIFSYLWPIGVAVAYFGFQNLWLAALSVAFGFFGVRIYRNLTSGSNLMPDELDDSKNALVFKLREDGDQSGSDDDDYFYPANNLTDAMVNPANPLHDFVSDDL